MFDPRMWSRRTLVMMGLLAALALPAVLSACSSDDESPCEDGEILSGGECIPAES